MSDIPPISGATQSTHVTPARSVPGGGSAEMLAPVDTVELSEVAQALGALEPGADVRVNKVLAVRGAIADGTYETQEKLEIAVKRLLEALRSSETS